MWSKLLVGLSITGGLCGIAALLSLFHLIPIETIVSVNKVEYVYEKLSLHMWFLEMIFAYRWIGCGGIRLRRLPISERRSSKAGSRAGSREGKTRNPGVLENSKTT